MATNYVQPGETITIVATAAIEAGKGRLENSLFGVAQAAAEVGDNLDLTTVGVWNLDADVTDTWVVGAPIFWSESLQLCVANATDDSSNSTDSNSGPGTDADALIGVCVKAKGSGESTVRVRLNGAATLV